MRVCFKNVDDPLGRVKVEYLHAQAIVIGLENDDVTVGRLMSLYFKVAKDHAVTRLLFDRLPVKELAAWNTLLFTYATWKPNMAMGIFAKLEKTEIIPKLLTFRALLNAHAHSTCSVGQAYGVLKKMIVEYDLEPDCTHFGCLVDKLVKRGYLAWAIWEIDGLKIGVSNHMCGMVFGACAKSSPVDIESAEKMIGILLRNGGSEYMVDYKVFKTLQRGGVKFPRCVKKGMSRGSAYSRYDPKVVIDV